MRLFYGGERLLAGNEMNIKSTRGRAVERIPPPCNTSSLSAGALREVVGRCTSTAADVHSGPILTTRIQNVLRITSEI